MYAIGGSIGAAGGLDLDRVLTVRGGP